MPQSFDGNAKSIEKVGSSINATDEELSNALIENSEAKNVELHHINDGLHQSLVDDDFSPLSGKPFYHCIVTITHLNRLYRMVFLAKLHPDLPTKTAPAVVTCRGKKWEMMFLGGNKKSILIFNLGKSLLVIMT